MVVTNGASDVETFGGDDLVCVTGDAKPGIWTGDGDDVVDSSQATGEFMTTVLGDGSDRFTGSSAGDTVWAGSRKRIGVDDTDRDVIDAGPPGAKADYVVSGEPGEPNSDEVRLGGAGTAPVPRPAHGPGRARRRRGQRAGPGDHRRPPGHHRHHRRHLRPRRRHRGLSGFDDFALSNEVETRYLTFRGSERRRDAHDDHDAQLGVRRPHGRW